MLYADVIVDISHEALDRPFQYVVCDSLITKIKVGSLVTVPFGPNNREKKAYVLSLGNEAKVATDKLKQILTIEDGDVTIESIQIQLAYWMAKRYGAPLSSCLKTVMPVSKHAKLPPKKIVKLNIGENEANEYLTQLLSKKRHSIQKENLLKNLISCNELPWDIITKKLNISSGVIRACEKEGLLKVEEISSHFVFKNTLKPEKKDITLNPAQQRIIDTFDSDLSLKKPIRYLIHGVTGSGKTEVYIQMLRRVLGDRGQAIVLIPEIALTFQTMMRFYNAFGDIVSVMHSRLTPAERYDIFKGAKSGNIRIIIGPRSALFTPFDNLKAIIIDEEHESSYKSEKTPRYQTVDVANYLADVTGAALVLGSATPSLESYYRAKKGEYKLLKLNERAGDAVSSKCEIVDLREELKSGNRSIISRRLYELMEKNLKENKQTMLFLNRRGLMGAVSCRECGEVVKCPHCDVSLSLHRDNRLYCHYCGFSTKNYSSCPKCGSKYIRSFKAGTQKTEEEVKKMFPSARILRMDYDSTRKKDGYEEILSAFSNRQADILIGTQMIVKGHDFPAVTLVGILAADLSLNANDYCCAERTFDLLTQAAGRAGRGDDIGHVIIQTYRPNHYAIQMSALQDYEGFYNKEIGYRDLVNYPPVSHMLLIMLLSKNEEAINRAGKKLNEALKEKYSRYWISDLLSPAISKLQDVYRRMIYIKSEDINNLIEIRTYGESLMAENKNITVYYDLDPINI